MFGNVVNQVSLEPAIAGDWYGVRTFPVARNGGLQRFSNQRRGVVSSRITDVEEG